MDAIALLDPISSAAFLKPAVKELGYKVVAIYTKPLSIFKGRYHLTEDELFSQCDEVIIAEKEADIVQQLKESTFSIKAAIPGLDSAVDLADQICRDLKFWSNPIESSLARRDKGEMRKLLKREGFSCPDFRLCQKEQEVVAFAEQHSFPLAIKTPQGAGTSQVYICDAMEDLLKKFHNIIEEKDFFGAQAKYAVVEEYISGREYCINTFSDGENVHVTDIWVYDKIDSHNFKNIYYNIINLPLSDSALTSFIEQGKSLIKAFEVQRGPAHLEIKDDPKKGPTLIEINARLAGARMPLFFKEFSNFDPYKKTIEVFVHGKTKIPSPIVAKKHFAVACCPLLQGGRVDTISGIEAIEKLPSYHAHLLNIARGDLYTPTTDLTTTPLLVFLAHEDRTQLLKDLEEAHALFSVKFTSFLA